MCCGLRDVDLMFWFGQGRLMCNTKQLLDEVEHDVVNYQNRGL